jgi:cytosine/adenosine deaminase-related metal-dependent hydrolase
VNGPRPTLVLRARHVLTMAGPAVENAWLWIRRGRIVAVGTGPAPAAARTIDLGDAIVLPGLINAHTHLEFSALPEPLDASGGLPGWIRRIVALRRGRPEADAGAGVAAAIRAGLAESAAAGVTAIGEIATTCTGDIVAAYAAAGPRLRVFCEALGLTTAAQAGASRRLAAGLDALCARGIAAGISPHAP